jgi:micrococcal nuclease
MAGQLGSLDCARSHWRALGLGLAAAALFGCGGDSDDEARRPAARSLTAIVANVVDGDTIRLANGERVRLVQIDAPELGRGDCYAKEARAELASLPRPREVRLEPDSNLDERDRFGRRLAYVHVNGTNVNVELVRRGAAVVWFRAGARGRYADRLLAAEERARAAGFGLWSACARRPKPGSTGQPHG